MANILDEFLILFRTRLTGDGIQRVNKQLGQTRNSLFKTSNLFKTFFAYDMYGAIRNLIPSMIDVAKKMGAMEARFYAVTGSTKLAREELAFVKEESDRLGLTFLETADNYSIFYASVKNTMGGGTARQIFTDWAESFRVLHIDPAKQERILYALREMSSKGKIYMQDLANQLGSHVPDAMGLAAKSMGYVGKDAVGRFRKDITAGKVDVQKFLVAFSSVVNQTYVDAEKLGNAMNKPDAQLATLANRWQSFQIAFTEAGFQDDLVDILKALNNMLPVLEKMAPIIYGIFQIVGIFLGASLIGRLGKLISFMTLLLSKTRALDIALRLISRLEAVSWIMAGLTNPLGWIVLVVGLLAFFIHKFFPNVEKALFSIWRAFKYDVEALMTRIDNWLAKHRLPFQFTNPNLASPSDQKKIDSDANTKWARIFPNNDLFRKMGILFDPTAYKRERGFIGDIKITNNITVPETTSTAQEIGDYLANSQKTFFSDSIFKPASSMIPHVKNHF